MKMGGTRDVYRTPWIPQEIGRIGHPAHYRAAKITSRELPRYDPRSAAMLALSTAYASNLNQKLILLGWRSMGHCGQVHSNCGVDSPNDTLRNVMCLDAAEPLDISRERRWSSPRYPEINLDYTQLEFPALAFNFPVSSQKFPVPLNRAFSCKSAESFNEWRPSNHELVGN